MSERRRPQNISSHAPVGRGGVLRPLHTELSAPGAKEIFGSIGHTYDAYGVPCPKRLGIFQRALSAL